MPESPVKTELGKGQAASVVKLVAFVIDEAQNLRASDVHIDPQNDALRVRYRIDGWLKEYHKMPLRLHHEIISRIKIIAGLRTDEHQAPQDGRFRVVSEAKPLDVRVSVSPTYYGENAVLRLLSDKAGTFTLESLGFSRANAQKLQEAIKKPYGMILATGYQASVTASPSDTVSYKIVVTAVEGDSDNISVRDVLPANLTNIGNVQTDGSYCNEDIASGIALGRLNEGQTRIITFTARVAGENSFGWGQTALTNTATVYVAGQSADATATVYVFRHAVMGATTVSTGFDDNALAAPVIAAISALLLAGFILRKKIARRFDRDPRQALAAKIAWVRKSGW